jgi:uncharacterized protein (DUF169 family)
VATVKQYNEYGETLERLLILRTSPLAVKMIEKEADIPKGAFRPKKDKGYHYAQCQAFALSRRERMTVAMLKEDHWCPAPVMAYGLDERPERANIRPEEALVYDSFEPGKYIGVLTAPLKSATYIPDVVLMYPNTSQLRSLLLSMPQEERAQINSYFFPPSCAYAVVNPIRTGQYWIVLPDPGEYERALGDEGEMMFSIPADKMDGLISNLKQSEGQLGFYTTSNMVMMPDFPQPELYKRVFEKWGLDYDKS